MEFGSYDFCFPGKKKRRLQILDNNHFSFNIKSFVLYSLLSFT